MLQKIAVINKCCSFELSIHQGILKQKKRNMVSTKILCNTTVSKIDNDNKWEAGQHIRMISEGSCDTEE